VQVDELPDLLKSHSSGVGMSLILRAARDVPLHLLSEEYEKVRLATCGGLVFVCCACGTYICTGRGAMGKGSCRSS
jgi:hypothetical protein